MSDAFNPSELIAAARSAGALSVRTDPPFRWASGAMMPVYNDNRRLLATPRGRSIVRRGLAQLVTEHGISCDAVAGTASAGIAPATLLAEELQLPLYYVRSEAKGHGRRRRIEGAPDTGLEASRVLLVEDLISTGGSSASAAEALSEAGAQVVACLAMFSYGFPRAAERFAELPGAPPIYTLATVDDLITDAASEGWLSGAQLSLLRAWRDDPFGWWERHSGGTGPALTEARSPRPRSAVHSAADIEAQVHEHLSTSAGRAGHLICVGLDPRPELLPPGQSLEAVLLEVLDAIAASGVPPAAFKPNIAFYHQLDRPHDGSYTGSRALSSVMTAIRERFPGVPVILDAKRGDIAATSSAYAREAYETWAADAVTVSPFMGDDSVEPILAAAGEHGGRWAYVLNRTSNPGAARFQNPPLAGDVPLYETVARTIQEWQRTHGTAGAVVGATAPEELRRLLEIHGAVPLPLLIPGVGTQGGDAATVIRALRDAGYPPALVRINVSRQILFPWAREGRLPDDWRAAVRDAYLRITEEAAW